MGRMTPGPLPPKANWPARSLTGLRGLFSCPPAGYGWPMDPNDPDLWRALQRLAGEYRLEDRGEGAGLILPAEWADGLALATLQFQDDGRLWLGLKDGRVLVEPWPEGEG